MPVPYKLGDKKNWMFEQMRYSPEEMTIIKATFSENEALVRNIRSFFLQFNEEELHLGEPVIRVLRKEILPEANEGEPIGSIGDIWGGVDTKISPEEYYPHVLSREKCVNYLEQQFENINKMREDWKREIVLKDFAKRPFSKKDPMELYTDMTARLTCLVMIDKCLITLVTLAGVKTESPAEVKKRLDKDSVK